MFFNLFSEYLIEENKLTKEQYLKLKEEQSKTRVKLGLIAVSEKMITERQSDEINRKQAVMDKRFGDIAVELGYLTSEQVSKLLDLQGNAYMMFCQNVTDNKFMTLNEVEECLTDYCKKNGFGEEGADALKSDDIDRIIPLFLPNLSKEAIELISISIRTVNRLISADLSIKKCIEVADYNFNSIAYQCLEGDFDVCVAFGGSDEGVLEIADSFAGEEFGTVDLDALDSVGEFINIINGLYATSLSYRKIQVELMAPVLLDKEDKLPVSNLWVIPLEINNKSVDFIVKVTKSN